MASYRESHKELAKTRIQRLITEFLESTETLAPQRSQKKTMSKMFLVLL